MPDLTIRDLRSHTILREVCVKHGLEKSAIKGRSRLRHITRAKQEYAWRLRTELEWSYPAVATALNWGDHTTAMHAVKAHEARRTQTEAGE